jgi:uncharacterized repeat protein (TIGR03943 family)
MISKSLHLAVLAVWTLFLAWLLSFGREELGRLLHPRLWWVLAVAVLALLFFLLSLIFSQGRKDEGKILSFELLNLLILLVPLLYFLPAKEARLDAASLENRLIRDADGLFSNTLPSFGIFGGSDSAEMLFTRIIREPRQFDQQEVEVVCQSFVHEDLPDNTAMCYRYMITCCAADALPAFLFLSHQDQIENNRWVKIIGSLSIIERESMEFPSIAVDTLQYVEEPDFPWAM